METGQTYRGKMFIDATYEGDLMAKAGVSYHVGREANKTYGETLNGVQVKNALHHQFIKKVDPYVKPGEPSSGLLPRRPCRSAGQGRRRGQARAGVQLSALCHRPAREPPALAEAGRAMTRSSTSCCCATSRPAISVCPGTRIRMPNRKTDSNNNFAFSTDDIGMNYDYPDGDYATRARIWQEHVDYQQGLMWTLANHPRVPQEGPQALPDLGPGKRRVHRHRQLAAPALCPRGPADDRSPMS